MADRESLLMDYYETMFSHCGPSNWWPGESAFEVAVGAILTQNTAWTNVAKAIAALREAGVLNPAAMLQLGEEPLSGLIRPAGYFRIKAGRLMNFLRFLEAEAGNPENQQAGSKAGGDKLERGPLADESMPYLHGYGMPELRRKLLEVSGIGLETADAILLYALNKTSFVVDAYTRRIFSRHGLVEAEISYSDLRDFFMDVLPPDPVLYNEYHALIVRVGKDYCLKSKPRCEGCPLRGFLEYEPDF